VADEDRFAMEALADLLRLALNRGVIQRADLWDTEGAVIEKLLGDTVCAAGWARFRGYSRVLRSAERPDGGYWVRVDAKKRWIDPLAQNRGRVSAWEPTVREEIRRFRELDFSAWLSGE
jgi:hypothetical protein